MSCLVWNWLCLNGNNTVSALFHTNTTQKYIYYPCYSSSQVLLSFLGFWWILLDLLLGLIHSCNVILLLLGNSLVGHSFLFLLLVRICIEEQMQSRVRILRLSVNLTITKRSGDLRHIEVLTWEHGAVISKEDYTGNANASWNQALLAPRSLLALLALRTLLALLALAPRILVVFIVIASKEGAENRSW